MPEKSSKELGEWYDAISRSYDDLYDKEQAEKHSRVLRLLEGKEVKVFVDLGCGTGRLLELVYRRSNLALGIDLSIQMLHTAKRRGPSIELVQADLQHLPLRNHIVDAVASVSVSESGSHLQAQIDEILRITSGTVLITVFEEPNQTSHALLRRVGFGRTDSFSGREHLYYLDRKPSAKTDIESPALV